MKDRSCSSRLDRVSHFDIGQEVTLSSDHIEFLKGAKLRINKLVPLKGFNGITNEVAYECTERQSGLKILVCGWQLED